MAESKRGKSGSVGDSRADRILHGAMAALGVAVTALMLSVFVYEAVRGPGRPPVIALEVMEIERAGEQWLATVRARNSGGETAAGVEIEGELTGDGGSETATITLDYLPDGSVRTGGLYFSSDPAQGNLRLRVLGYADP